MTQRHEQGLRRENSVCSLQFHSGIASVGLACANMRKTRGGLLEALPWQLIVGLTTTTAALPGGCSRLRHYLPTAIRMIASRSSTIRYFRNSENLMSTTSPRAHPDPGQAWAVGPGRADAPRVMLEIYRIAPSVGGSHKSASLCSGLAMRALLRVGAAAQAFDFRAASLVLKATFGCGFARLGSLARRGHV